MYFKSAWKNHVKSVLIAALLIIILYSTFRIANNLESSSLSQFLTEVLWLNLAAYSVLVLLGVIIIHCALHQVIYKFFDGSIFKGIKALNHNITNGGLRTLDINQSALVELLPLALVNIACTFIPEWLGQMIFVCNILVSIGDVNNLLQLRMSRNYSYVKPDEPNHINYVTEIKI